MKEEDICGRERPEKHGFLLRLEVTLECNKEAFEVSTMDDSN